METHSQDTVESQGQLLSMKEFSIKQALKSSCEPFRQRNVEQHTSLYRVSPGPSTTGLLTSLFVYIFTRLAQAKK